MIYIGIDPGLNGAVGVLKSHGSTYVDPGSIQVFDTPTMLVSGIKEKRVYNTVRGLGRAQLKWKSMAFLEKEVA